MRKSWILGMIMSVDKTSVSNLAKAWSKNFVADGTTQSEVKAALTRTIPLLDDPLSVPFVVRYRADVIAPLSTHMIHQLSSFLQLHKSLHSLRERIFERLPDDAEQSLRFRVETSISKSELEDLYAPYKPAAKGSLEERIQLEHPELISACDAFWSNPNNFRVADLQPIDAAVTVLANRIASHPDVLDACQEFTHENCQINVKAASSSSKEKSPSAKDLETFQTYFDFHSFIRRIRDHQVLAIRRGIDRKALKMSFEINGDEAESIIHASLGRRCADNRHAASLWKLAIHDAWSRLLRKRCTTRVWKHACTLADERAIKVFCDNLRKALLAPPAQPPSAVLGVDPGFKAGIKTVIVDADGQVVKGNDGFKTIHFVGKESEAEKQIADLLSAVQELQSPQERIHVALGYGHGSQEARKLILNAANTCHAQLDIHLVDEAGASVWSVTEAAEKEFSGLQPASIAAASIARRYQNPLHELVKIPPRSLGLGMYQHDFTEKVLDEKLHITSVDAVAEVGVDANSCSHAILEKVPGLTAKLAEKIIKARPIKSRDDLRKIAGLGPKTFENCAGFIRVRGINYLDRTMCHPESYQLATFLLKKLNWNTDDPESIIPIPSEEDMKTLVESAAWSFHMTEDRVRVVLDHLIRSFTNPDPRVVDHKQKPLSDVGDPGRCSPLSPSLSDLESLRKACPVRNVIGYVRNVLDFGVFVDFGGEKDELIHRSMLGPVEISSLLVGKEVGVDVLGVSASNRVTLSLSGLNYPPQSNDSIPNKNKTPGRDVKRKKTEKSEKSKTRQPNDTNAKKRRYHGSG